MFPRLARARPVFEQLIVRKIIRPRLRRRRKYLVALDVSPPMPARNELIFVRVGRDDPGAARRQTINQPSIGRDSKHSDADRTLARRRCSSNAFLFAPRARLIRSSRLCSLGAFRRRRSSQDERAKRQCRSQQTSRSRLSRPRNCCPKRDAIPIGQCEAALDFQQATPNHLSKHDQILGASIGIGMQHLGKQVA